MFLTFHRLIGYENLSSMRSIIMEFGKSLIEEVI